MKWQEVIEFEQVMRDLAPWRLMEVQQRAPGEWVAVLYNTETHERAEAHSGPGFRAFLAAIAVSPDALASIAIPLETATAITNFVNEHSQATVADIMAEFDLSEQEALLALATAHYVLRELEREQAALN